MRLGTASAAGRANQDIAPAESRWSDSEHEGLAIAEAAEASEPCKRPQTHAAAAAGAMLAREATRDACASARDVEAAMLSSLDAMRVREKPAISANPKESTLGGARRHSGSRVRLPTVMSERRRSARLKGQAPETESDLDSSVGSLKRRVTALATP